MRDLLLAWPSLCIYSTGPVARRPTAEKPSVEAGGLGRPVESLALIIDFGGYIWQGAQLSALFCLKCFKYG